VKAVKAAENARRQEAAKLEEKLKRKELMKDRAIAAREAKQRLEEEKRRQLLIDQQKKGEQMKKRGEEAARKKRERDDLLKKERDDKRRKMELELKNRKIAEERAATQKFTMGTAPTSKHPSTYKGLHMKDHKESGHMNKSQKTAVSAGVSQSSKPVANDAPRSNFNAKAKPFSAASSNRMPNYGGAEAPKAEFKQPSQSIKPFSAKEKALNKNSGPMFREQVAQPKAPQMNVLYSSSAQNNQNKENAVAAFSFGSKAINSLVQKTPELKMMQQQQRMNQEYQTPVMRFQNKPKESLQSYQMTPYRSDSEESDDEGQAAKPVPQWAKSKNLSKQLQQQMKADPDEIFKAHATSCSLDDVFKTGKPKPCYKRRGSSGNWLEDRMTWKEEWFYKKAMGYL
jgi:hypothetical protein